MPDITVKHLDEMERYTGAFQHGQEFFFAGKSLGLSNLGMNAIRPAQRHNEIVRGLFIREVNNRVLESLGKVASVAHAYE